MTTFLVDNELVYTYDTLQKDISNTDSYYQRYRTDNLYNFFLNIIRALLANKPITLIDSDLNDSEIEGIDYDQINRPFKIKCFGQLSMDSIVNLIKESSSEIEIFTSGTTGQPKKVTHSIDNLTRTVRLSNQYKEHVWGFAYNPTHMAGLQVFFQALLNNNTIINLFNKERKFIYQAIDQYSITHISATPTFYRLLLPIENSYSSVRRITLGGEKSDSNLYSSILEIFPKAKINNIYASTEAGSLFAASGENFRIPLSVKEKIIVEEGELLIHKSLLGKSDSFVFNGEYYHTGDLIEWVDKEEGLFRFKSRKNELVNVGGYKVNPSEVEEAISQIPGVLQVLVYGKESSVLGNILCAQIKQDKKGSLSEVTIRTFLSDKIQDYKIPRMIKFVESISLTRTGKIKRI